VISGNDLSTNPPLINLRGFGTSLASGVDVDGNTYNGENRKPVLDLLYSIDV